MLSTIPLTCQLFFYFIIVSSIAEIAYGDITDELWNADKC